MRWDPEPLPALPLGSAEKLNRRSIVGRVVAVAHAERVVVDLGDRDGVRVRDVAVFRWDERPVKRLGIVVSTEATTSTVDLCFDVRSPSEVCIGQVVLLWRDLE